MGKLLTRLLVYAVAAIVITAARGWIMAFALDGRYPLKYLAYDGPAFAVVVIGLVLFDTGLREALRRAFGTRGWARQTARHGLYVLIMPIAVFPLLMATLQFHPQRIATKGTPRDWGLEYSDVALMSDGLRLSAWFISAARPETPIVLVAHGLNASKENFLPAAVLAHDLGYDVLTFDFRAHGDSEGHTTTFGYNEANDLKAAHDWIQANHPHRPVYVLAYSMGGAAALRAAAEYGIFDRIVLDSTFSSVENVAHASLLQPLGPAFPIVWNLGRFWGWLWSGVDIGQHRPIDRMRELHGRPLLLIHGTGDELIPFQESVRLQAAGGGQAELWLVDGAGHVQSINHADYKERLREFFSRVLPE